MIRCNLSILLAERNLKISRVSEATGISRTTLTALSNNTGKGVQFDTINTLCSYLKTTPDKLISYIPVDIRIKSLCINGDILEIDLEIIKNLRSYLCCLTGSCFATYENNKLTDLDISVDLFDESLNDNDDELIEENKTLISSFSILSTPFRNDIENQIIDNILSKLDGYDMNNEITLSFVWDNRLVFG